MMEEETHLVTYQGGKLDIGMVMNDLFRISHYMNVTHVEFRPVYFEDNPEIKAVRLFGSRKNKVEK